MVTRAADYALRATLTLVGLPPGTRLCLSELAAECDVPPAYLSKVLQALTRAGLVTAHRGITGGYELTASGRGSSVLDIVDALDGLPLLNACVLSGGCHRSPACPAHPVWIQAQERLREVLSAARVADLSGAAADVVPVADMRTRRSRVEDRVTRDRAVPGRCGQTAGRDRRRRGATHLKRMENR